MRKLILTALIAATAFPIVASAQSRDDRQAPRQDERRTNSGYGQGNRSDFRDDRRNVRPAPPIARDDRNRAWGRNDWRDYRSTNRNVYARGNWRAPFRYNAFRAGGRIAPSYYGSQYFINDPWRYRLPPAGFNQRWVRHYNDVLLVDTRRGFVIDVIRNFYW